MTTLADAVDTIGYRLGNRTDLDDRIAAEIRLAQVELEQGPDLPWFLVSEVAYATTSAGEERLGLPSDFLREYEEGCLWLYDADQSIPWIQLGKESLEDLRAATEQELIDPSGAPTHYAVSGGYFRLFPTPDDTYTIKMVYYKKATTLTADADTNDWLTNAPEVLISEAGLKMAAHIKDASAMQAFQMTYDRAWNRLQLANAERKHVNADYRMTYGG